ncbi:hypothetical protein GCM10027346_14980 [Hymenobacter seoulensis]
MNRSSWLLRGLKFLLFGALLVAVAGFVTMSLWNWLIPSLFNGPYITFWQTLGLLVLSRILFGGFRGGRAGGWARHRRAWRQKMESRMAHLTPEEQEKFRQKMRASCGPAWLRRQPAEDTQTAPMP